MGATPQSDGEPPSHAELTAQLRALMTKGLPAAQPEDVEPLLELHAVRALALVDLPSARLAALRERIAELAAGTRDELLRHLAPYAFNTYSTATFPLESRLRHASSSGIGHGYESLRKTYLRRLASNFAHRVLWLEYRLRHNSWLERPFDVVEHDETLRQHDFYTAMAFWLNGAARDIEAALSDPADHGTNWFDAYAQSALWRWTQYVRHGHRHNVQFLGAWSLDLNHSKELGEAIRAAHDAEALPPITPRQRSWLRVELLTALYEELDPFVSALERQAAGRQVLASWTGWLRSCHCCDEPDSDECSVHRFVEEAETFTSAMNEAVSEQTRIDRAARFRTLPDVY